MNCDSPKDPDRHLLDESARRKICEAWKERDRFERKWFKGGILIDFCRRRESESEIPAAEHGNRLANSIPYYSRHREEITTKELHDLLIHRIYHEDNLLQMRNYNFITTNAFLGVGFAAVIVIRPTEEIRLFGFVLAAFGFLWALLQVAYGKRQLIATAVWTQQVWMAEKSLGTKFDLTLFEFYVHGETNTPFGIIKTTDKKKRPPNKSFPYNLPFFTGTTALFGVIFPRMMAVFWATLTVFMLYNHSASWLVPRSRGEVEPYDFCSGGEPRYEMRQHCAMMPSKEATTGGASWP